MRDFKPNHIYYHADRYTGPREIHIVGPLPGASKQYVSAILDGSGDRSDLHSVNAASIFEHKEDARVFHLLEKGFIQREYEDSITDLESFVVFLTQNNHHDPFVRGAIINKMMEFNIPMEHMRV